MKCDQASVQALLDKHNYEFLGERNLVSCFRKGIKWNTVDEKCTTVNIRQKQASVERVMITGQVFNTFLPRQKDSSNSK